MNRINTKTATRTTPHLSGPEMEAIYRRQQRLYWEADFINRCIDRRLNGTGLCNLPYETLPEKTALLDQAYDIYNHLEDSNTAYNVTLDLVIDEIEQRIRNNAVNRDTASASGLEVNR